MGTNRIGSEADIFSIGCVISDAAAWVAFGPQGPVDYHDRRIEATKGSFEDRGHEGCFHNGLERLPAVDEMHNLIRQEACRTSDSITPQVVNLVQTHMLVQNPRDRL